MLYTRYWSPVTPHGHTHLSHPTSSLESQSNALCSTLETNFLSRSLSPFTPFFSDKVTYRVTDKILIFFHGHNHTFYFLNRASISSRRHKREKEPSYWYTKQQKVTNIFYCQKITSMTSQENALWLRGNVLCCTSVDWTPVTATHSLKTLSSSLQL